LLCFRTDYPFGPKRWPFACWLATIRPATANRVLPFENTKRAAVQVVPNFVTQPILQTVDASLARVYEHPKEGAKNHHQPAERRSHSYPFAWAEATFTYLANEPFIPKLPLADEIPVSMLGKP